MADRIGTHMIAVSGDSEDELEKKLALLPEYLKTCQNNGFDLTDVAFSVNTSPEVLHPHRAVVIGKSYEQLLRNLNTGNVTRGIADKTPPKLCFLFSGMGSTSPGAGKQLNETSPVFRKHMELVEEASLASYQESNTEDEYSTLKEILWTEPYKLNSRRDAFTAHFRLNFLLLNLWENWGIVPDVVLGSSLGEFIASYSARIIRELYDAIKIGTSTSAVVIYCEEGGMMSLPVDDKRSQKLVEDFNKTAGTSEIWAEVAIANSTYQTVVALSKAAIDLFRDFCATKKVKADLLPIPSPFHSRAFDPVLKETGEGLGRIKIHFPPRCQYISSLTGQLQETPIVGNIYWPKLLRDKNQFQQACYTAYNTGARTFVEIGSHPILSAFMLMNIDELDDSDPIQCLPTLQNGSEDWTTLMITFGTLYTMGYSCNWDALYSPYKPNRVQTPFDKV